MFRRPQARGAKSHQRGGDYPRPTWVRELLPLPGRPHTLQNGALQLTSNSDRYLTAPSNVLLANMVNRSFLPESADYRLIPTPTFGWIGLWRWSLCSD